MLHRQEEQKTISLKEVFITGKVERRRDKRYIDQQQQIYKTLYAIATEYTSVLHSIFIML